MLPSPNRLSKDLTLRQVNGDPLLIKNQMTVDFELGFPTNYKEKIRRPIAVSNKRLESLQELKAAQ